MQLPCHSLCVAFRYDVCTVRADAIERTPMGAIRIPASLTRSGVFMYHTADGRVIREYRPPEEVAKADALRTIEDMPVTIGHPPGGVSPSTFAALSVGHVRGDTVKTDASAGPLDVTAKLVIARKDAI